MSLAERIKSGRYFYKSLGSLNLGAMCVGLAIGWPKPSYRHMRKVMVNTHDYFHNESWVESAVNLGASVGSFLPIWLADKYGRRVSFLSSGSVLVLFWICLACLGNNADLILLSASIGGCGTGIFFTTTILYIGEISSAKNRGIAAALTVLFVNIGILIVMCIAPFIKIHIMAFMLVSIPVLFLLSVHFWMVESPYFLFQQGKVLDARISLRSLRSDKTTFEIDDEFKALEDFFKSNHSNEETVSRSFTSYFCPQTIKRSVVLSLPFICISQMIGAHAMSEYTEKVVELIFRDYGLMVISAISVTSILVCIYIIEKLGRRPLLLFSIAGSALTSFILGSYNVMQHYDCQLHNDRTPFPMLLLALYHAVYAIGLTPILPLLSSEVFPNRMKTVIVATSTAVIYIAAFGVERVYQVLNLKTSACLAFGGYTILGSIALPVAIFMIPETKGKTLNQIQDSIDKFSVIVY